MIENAIDASNYYKELVYSKIRYYLQSYYNMEFNATQIDDDNGGCLFISDLASACNIIEMKKRGITHVLSVVLGLDPLYPTDFVYKNVHIRDNEMQNLCQYFDECSKFIDDAIKNGGKVLVHCSYGISRSASIVIAYYINTKKMSYMDAYEYVKSKRTIIEPNDGFKKQLLLYSNPK